MEEDTKNKIRTVVIAVVSTAVFTFFATLFCCNSKGANEIKAANRKLVAYVDSLRDEGGNLPGKIQSLEYFPKVLAYVSDARLTKDERIHRKLYVLGLVASHQGAEPRETRFIAGDGIVKALRCHNDDVIRWAKTLRGCEGIDVIADSLARDLQTL